ncbi:MAG: nitroreductase family protein [Bacteroidales bacterium]|nr:nitroreductase family protein [Bacteroidales bacterium]
MKIPESSEMLNIIRMRQSDRGYTDKPVEEDKIERIVEAARLAPSACNAQPWKFIVVTDPLIREKVAEAASAKALGMNTFVSQAPVLIVIVREKPNLSSRIGASVKDKDYSLMDIGIASGFISLQACAEGLGSCIMGWFNEKLVRKILGIPSGKRIELIISVGYPSKDYREKRRKPPEEVFSYNKY